MVVEDRTSDGLCCINLAKICHVECSNEDKKTGLSGTQVGHKRSSSPDKCQRVSAKVTQLDQVQQGSGSAKEVEIKN